MFSIERFVSISSSSDAAIVAVDPRLVNWIQLDLMRSGWHFVLPADPEFSENANMANEKLQMRINAETKQRLEEAAAKQHLDLYPWALSVLKREAARVLDGEGDEVLDSISRTHELVEKVLEVVTPPGPRDFD